MPSRQVDGNTDLAETGVEPGFTLRAGRTQDPLVDGENQSRVFGDRDEFVGVEQTAFRVLTSYSIHYTKLYDPRTICSAALMRSPSTEGMNWNLMIPPLTSPMHSISMARPTATLA